MNFPLTKIPQRTTQPRVNGITVISDKGLSLAETRNILSVGAAYIDMVKLAFGTALVTPVLKEKIKLYQECGLPVFFGGLLFEAFFARNQVKEYLKLMEQYAITCVEISDGAINIPHNKKCRIISELCKTTTVISEIGSKDKDKLQITPPYRWIQLMQAELDAGSSYVIAEAKETGTVGIYRDSGEVREGLVEEILTRIPAEKIIWEAPKKDQQLYFIKLLGSNVNLANIAPAEVIAMEAMRIGLRSDSFHFFLAGD